VEIAYDPIEMADSPGIESGSKLRSLKGVNWQRLEEVLRAERAERLASANNGLRSSTFFNVGLPELRSLSTIIFHSTTNFARNNEFRTRLYIQQDTAMIHIGTDVRMR
jgi:hypothetical protein